MQRVGKIQTSKKRERNHANRQNVFEKEIVFREQVLFVQEILSEKVLFEKIVRPQVFAIGRKER